MKKITSFSLFTFGILGFLKIFSITPFNRMAADDFSSALMARLGIWGSLITTYKIWMGRFTSILIETVYVTYFGKNTNILLFSFITFCLLIISFIVLFKRTLKSNYKDVLIYILSLVAIAGLYQLTPNKSESWYWLTGSVTYLWPIILINFGISYLFLDKLKTIEVLTSAFLVFVAVGCNEVFGLLVTLSYLAVYILSNRTKLVLVSLIAAILAFSIMFFAPGNLVRRQSVASNPMSIPGSILYSLKDGPETLAKITFNNLYFLVPLTLVLICVLSSFAKLKRQNMKVEDILINIFVVIVISTILSIFYSFLGYMNLGRILPDRTEITLSYVIFLMVCIISYLSSQVVSKMKLADNLLYKFAVLIFSTALIKSAFVFTKTLASDVYIAKDYSGAYDAMIKDFERRSIEGDFSDVEVSLPEHGLITETLDPPGDYDYKNDALSKIYRIGKVMQK